MGPEEGGYVPETIVKTDRQLTCIKDGPTLSEVIAKETPRDNKINSILQDDTTDWKKVGREFTEREGLQDLSNFLDLTVQRAQQTNATDTLKEATALRDNLVYVGESELQEATAGLAEHVKSRVEQGKSVFLYIAGNRSERYISMRIMEEFDAITEDNQDIRRHVRFSNNPDTIAEQVAQNPNSEVMIPDDFVFSGSRIQESNGKMERALQKAGNTQKVETLLIAAPSDKYTSETMPVDKITAYYGLKTEPLKNLVFTGIAVTGSHCSTDYGFEAPIRDFQKFLKDNGQEVQTPLLMNIVRPYDNESTSATFVGYKDPELQQRWGKIERKYSLSPQQST